MTVIVANDTPPYVRGMLKRWFIEPRANVFVGTVSSRTRDNVLEYLRRNAPDFGMLMVASDASSQGFVISSFGETKRRPTRHCGLHLIAEKWLPEEEAEEGREDAGV